MKRKAILLLIAGCITLATTIAGLIMIIIGIGQFSTVFVIGLYLFALSVIVCVPCLADANREFKTIKREKIANSMSDSTNDNEEAEDEEAAKTEMVQAIKDIVVETIEQSNNEPLNTPSKPVKYCIACGCAIDKNSNFCKICGKEQE